MENGTLEYTLDVRYNDVLHIVRPETREIDVYDPEQGAMDGIPSHIYQFTGEQFPVAVRKLLENGVLL